MNTKRTHRRPQGTARQAQRRQQIELARMAQAQREAKKVKTNA